MERVMSELAHYFCANEAFEVHLILYGITREIFYNIPENIKIHKPDFEFDNSKRTWNTIKTLWFLRKKIKEIKPDAVLSFGELWNNFVLLATFGLNYPIFVSDRCQPDKKLSKFHNILRKWLYPKSAGVICQTEKAKEIFQGTFSHHKFSVIGNPIREIKPDSNAFKENIVLSVGRLIETKHHDELIRIFAKLNPENWELVIVGDDAIKQKNKVKLEALVKNLQMEGKIILTGKRNNVDDFYRRAKIFAFTSSSEGFPNVIGEAMSAGLPVVAFDCIAGPSEMIIDGENGFLVPLFYYELFAERLKSLIKNEQLRDVLGNNAKKSIRRFSIDNIGSQFEKVIL